MAHLPYQGQEDQVASTFPLAFSVRSKRRNPDPSSWIRPWEVWEMGLVDPLTMQRPL